MRRGEALVIAGLALLLAAAPARLEARAPAADAGDRITADTAWDGGVLVERPLTVAAGVTLTVRPGARIRFREGVKLLVEGTLLAEGTAERPILFDRAVAEQTSWDGIALVNPDSPSRLTGCRIRGARALAILGGSHAVERCEITEGALGIEVNGDTATPVIRANSLRDLKEGGVRCLGRAAPLVEQNVIERCGPFGVHAEQAATPLVRGNTISECTSGIEVIQAAPFVRDNRVRECERGIALSSADGGKPVEGNTVEGCGTGILVQHFSAPEIEANTVAYNREGIACIMGARPSIRNNAIRDNDTGISCVQIATPTIEANDIERNRRGVYLTLSSYAVVRGNNLEGNRVHLELGNMSRDWERRVGRKPMRGLQQQATARAERGLIAPPGGAPPGDGLDASGDAVEAAGNWWGVATTREMERKGPDADIEGLRDWHDVPTLTYEGYEGEYVQDRIRYAPWASERIAGTGLPGAAARAGTGSGR